MLNENFVKTIEAIDGVTGIKAMVLYGRRISCKWNFRRLIQGFSQDEQSDLEKNLIKGTADYDELIGTMELSYYKNVQISVEWMLF